MLKTDSWLGPISWTETVILNDSKREANLSNLYILAKKVVVIYF